MKNQQVSVDYWAMAQTMGTYLLLTFLCWIFCKLVGAIFHFPGKLREQQDHIQRSLRELQERYPDLDTSSLTEELENLNKERKEKIKEIDKQCETNKTSIEERSPELKKTE